MIVYLDTSVILSRLLKQANQYTNWGHWESCYTSVLSRVEFYRTIDRMRLHGRLTDTERVDLQDQFGMVEKTSYQVALSQHVLDQACMAMPTVLRTLNAVHLVTALQVKNLKNIQITFLTHDAQLATGARAFGLHVEGI